jgi:ABC-type transporter Mla subunit MlaD
MRRRGNKRAGPVAIVIFAMIGALVVTICWLAAQGFQKEPNGPPRGSQTLPAQAAQLTVTATPPNAAHAR